MLKTKEIEGLTIKKASQVSGLSRDTIRYYEKIGLLPRAKRRSNGHRTYGQKDLFKLNIITCLKKTGMPLEDMKPYLNVYPEANPKEFSGLFDMMRSHRRRIEQQMQDLQQVLDFIDVKMEEGMQATQICGTE